MRKEKSQILNITDKSIFLNVSDEIFEKASYLFFSGGTTSNPKILPFNRVGWKENNGYRAKCYKSCGVKKKEKVAIMLPFGPWIAGPSAQDAMEMAECRVFPLGTVDTDRELFTLLKIIIDNQIRIFVTTPSFLAFILRTATKYKLDLTIDKVFTSGEITSNCLRKATKKIIKAVVYSCYASSESFIGIECKQHSGYHFDPEHINLEIYDDGQFKNNLLITAKKSFLVPINKYKIGDLGIIRKNCTCGSHLPRVVLLGRCENGFLVNGAVNVYPYQIKDALFSIGLDFIECNVNINRIENDVDLVSFTIKTSNKSVKISAFAICAALKRMSIDFSDAIYHGIVKIRVIQKYIKRDIDCQKSKIIINDERSFG